MRNMNRAIAFAGLILAVIFVLAVLLGPSPASAAFMPLAGWEGTCDLRNDCCLPDRDEIDDFMLPSDKELMETICRGNPGGAGGGGSPGLYAMGGGWASGAAGGPGLAGGAGGSSIAGIPGVSTPLSYPPMAAVSAPVAGAGWPGTILLLVALLLIPLAAAAIDRDEG
jgi:hypothetical protein